MDKELWRVRWLDAISELVDFDLQLRTWLNPTDPNPHWSYVEFMCCYFDDVLVGLPYRHFMDNGWVSEPEYACLKEWHEAVDAYKVPGDSHDSEYDNQAILNDSEWRRIVALGAEARKKLLQLTA